MTSIWLARDKNGELWGYLNRPIREEEIFKAYGEIFSIIDGLFPEITWENSPVEFIKKSNGGTTMTEKQKELICTIAGVNEIGDLSDGYHTFNALYHQRMVLFAALVKAYKDKAWKSWKHEDGELCFGGGWFIVGIDTPQGSYTYHYEEKYWGLFDCIALERAKHWDGHTDKDVMRLMSL